MDRDTIIDGLRMTMDLFTFDPSTGEEKDPDDLNDLNRTTYDACKGALEILERLDTDSDTISRAKAIEALVAETIYTEEELREYYEANSHRDEWVNGIYEAVEAIKQLPPAQPERIKAKWLPVGMADAVGGESAMWGDEIAYHACDNCWQQALEKDGEEVLSDFCPHCGAEMREVTE